MPISYTASPPELLTLAPSELPPGCTAPLSAPADGRLVANGKIVTLRLVRLQAGKFVLYARWNERNALVLRDGAPQIWQTKPTPQKLRAIAARFARDSSWKFASVHLISRPQQGNPVVALNRNLHPFTSYPTDFALTDGTLGKPIAFEAEFDRNQSEFNIITRALETPGSFARFAWLWLRSNPAQRDALWNAQLAKRAELKQLMTWILWCCAELWQMAEALGIKYDYHDWQHNWYYNADSQGNWMLTLSAAAEKWIEAWSAFLSSRFQPTHIVQIQSYIGSQSDDRELGQSPFISQPSAHEQLEARLHLRDWLQRNAPEKLDELMPA